MGASLVRKVALGIVILLLLNLFLIPIVQAAADPSDSDGDGISNKEELDLGTNPNDKNSKPDDYRHFTWMFVVAAGDRDTSYDVDPDKWFVIPIVITVLGLLVFMGVNKIIFRGEMMGGDTTQKTVGIVIGMAFAIIAVFTSPLESWFAGTGNVMLWIALGVIAIYFAYIGIVKMWTGGAVVGQEFKAARVESVRVGKELKKEMAEAKKEEGLAEEDKRAINELEQLITQEEPQTRIMEGLCARIKNTAAKISVLLQGKGITAPLWPRLRDPVKRAIAIIEQTSNQIINKTLEIASFDNRKKAVENEIKKLENFEKQTARKLFASNTMIKKLLKKSIHELYADIRVNKNKLSSPSGKAAYKKIVGTDQSANLDETQARNFLQAIETHLTEERKMTDELTKIEEDFEAKRQLVVNAVKVIHPTLTRKAKAKLLIGLSEIRDLTTIMLQIRGKASQAVALATQMHAEEQKDEALIRRIAHIDTNVLRLIHDEELLVHKSEAVNAGAATADWGKLR